MTRAHTAAVLTQMRTDPILANFTYEGIVLVPAGGVRPEAYCSVFTNTGIADTDRFTGLQSRVTIRFVIHSIGKRPDQAQLVADRVVDLLTNWIPPVDGWRCERLRHAASQTTQIDREVPGYPLYYAVDEFDLVTFKEAIDG